MTTGTTPVDMRVEYDRAPVNVRPDRPRFSWRLEEPGAQTAYRIFVSRSPDAITDGVGDTWDSGKVEDRRSTNVEYDGAQLGRDEIYYWSVRVWDANGDPTDFADPVSFGTALGDESEWAGRWIGHRPGDGDTIGFRTAWRPAADEPEPWVQVDLGERREFETVELHPVEALIAPTTPDGLSVVGNAIRGFGFPSGLRIDVADDPSFDDTTRVATWSESGDESNESTPAEPRIVDVDSTKARYLRVTATDPYTVDHEGRDGVEDYLDLRAWSTLALAAVAVRDGSGRDLARGAPVEASASYEADGWGIGHLTNGRYASELASTSPILRTEFELDGSIEQARLHVGTLGYGECYLNGERLGDERLNPGWTKYDERVLYDTYDVTDSLTEGANAIGLWLGRGWFAKSAHFAWTGYGSPRVIAHLSVEYADGSTRTVGTDHTWRADGSPIVENDVYDGETYDARLEQSGWAEPCFDDGDWDAATEVASPGGALEPQRSPPIRETGTLGPVSIHERGDEWIVDFGRNHTGWVELDVAEADRGDEITIRHAEALDEDGALLTEDLRGADATDVYVACGDEQERYAPRFTYHGYRYAAIEGYPGTVDEASVRSTVVHTDLERAGEFDCANEDLNRVQENCRWGLLTNAHSVPTDCPQRDERMGWTGDAQVATRALLYNVDGARFHEKWMRDHDENQSPAGFLPPMVPSRNNHDPFDPTWPVTRVTVPWYLYCHYGDEGVLERHYESMRRYVEYWLSVAEDGVVPEEYGAVGDWLDLANDEDRRGPPFALFNTAFVYRVTDLLGEIAGVLGLDADATRYRERADEIARAFDREFFEDGVYGPGTQAALAVPLFLGLVPDEREDAIVASLVDRVRADGSKLTTGFLGTRALVHALAEHGHADLAYRVVSRSEFPGWVYMVRQGATTVWEHWDTDERVGSGMNSRNHSPFAFVSEWFYRVLAGIEFTRALPEAGRIEIEPAFVPDLPWARGSVETTHGTVASAWERRQDGIRLAVEIPWNLEGTIRLPLADADAVVVDGATIWDVDSGAVAHDCVERVVAVDGGALEIVVASGSHEFEVVR